MVETQDLLATIDRRVHEHLEARGLGEVDDTHELIAQLKRNQRCRDRLIMGVAILILGALAMALGAFGLEVVRLAVRQIVAL